MNLPAARLTPSEKSVVPEKYDMAHTKIIPRISNIIGKYLPFKHYFSSLTIIGIAKIIKPINSELI